MYSKAQIFNLALGALLLEREITETETDKSNEAAVLRTHYNVAFMTTLVDLDLNSTSTRATLELIETDPIDEWSYAYKYPSDCAFLRRIVSGAVIDDSSTFVDKRVVVHDGQKVIFTNKESAKVEYISESVSLSDLAPSVGLAIAYKLAYLSAPLIVGKGARSLRKAIREDYLIAKGEAQEQDKWENFGFVPEDVESEFVRERMS